MTDAKPAPSQFRRYIEQLEKMGPAALAEMMPPAPSREELLAQFPDLAAVEVRDVVIDGPHGDVPARAYAVPGASRATGFVWVHGGGFVGGDLDMPEAHWVSLALAARGFPVLSVEYRKALNGVHYPIPSDDVLAAWNWATAHASDLGASPSDLHLGGASAGGNLVAGVTKRLRDAGGPMPASLVLVYPALHGELPTPSESLRAALASRNDGTDVGTISTNILRDICLQYAGSEEMLGDPYAFPANGELGGQPPVFILDSEADPLRASGEAYGDALRAAGVDVTVEFEPGTGHGHVNEPFTPGAQRSIQRIAAWLRSTRHRGGGDE
jgi:acetyl esterase/lipase